LILTFVPTNFNRTTQDNDKLAIDLKVKQSQLEYFSERLDQIRSELSGMRKLSEEVEGKLGRGEISDIFGKGGAEDKSLSKDVRRLTYRNSENELLDQMFTEIQELEQETQLEKVRSLALTRFLNSRSALIRSIPTLRPVDGGYISSVYGKRQDPFTGALKMHAGIDFANSNNVPVYSTAEGVVTQTTYNETFGNVVIIYHGFGISSLYAHLQSYSIKPGDWVDRGHVIGKLGNSGRSTDLHLHYEVHLEGRPVNPYYFLPLEEEG
jgi:murein DD-endopeptidase MepM/ murein hydrolase activator NlpD